MEDLTELTRFYALLNLVLIVAMLVAIVTPLILLENYRFKKIGEAYHRSYRTSIQANHKQAAYLYGRRYYQFVRTNLEPGEYISFVKVDLGALAET